MRRDSPAEVDATSPDPLPGSTGPGTDWSALVDTVAAGDLVATLQSPSGRRVVLMSAHEYERLIAAPHSSDRQVSLTSREREILSLISEGLSGSAVAHRLGLAVNTVAQHLASARRKLGVRSSSEAVLRARRIGQLD